MICTGITHSTHRASFIDTPHAPPRTPPPHPHVYTHTHTLYTHNTLHTIPPHIPPPPSPLTYIDCPPPPPPPQTFVGTPKESLKRSPNTSQRPRETAQTCTPAVVKATKAPGWGPTAPKAQAPRPKAPKAQGTNGPRHQRPKAPMAQGTNGPRHQRPKAPTRPKAPKVPRHQWPKAPMAQGTNGPRHQWPKAVNGPRHFKASSHSNGRKYYFRWSVYIIYVQSYAQHIRLCYKTNIDRRPFLSCLNIYSIRGAPFGVYGSYTLYIYSTQTHSYYYYVLLPRYRSGPHLQHTKWLHHTEAGT